MKNFVFLLLVLTIAGCKSGNETEEKKLLPVYDILQSDEQYALNFAGAIMYKKSVNAKLVDSSMIDTARFKQIIEQLWVPELQPERFNQLFTEVPVVDGTSGELQFHYFPKENISNIEQIQIVTKTTDQKTNVQSVYMVIWKPEKDKKTLQKVTWKLKQYLQIVTQTDRAEDSIIVEELIWEPSLFFQE